MRKALFGFGIAVLLAACTPSERGLRDLRNNGGGPDEFSVLPVNPLVLPEDVATLPTPTPGGTNRSDRAPNAEAIAALGGDTNALVAGGIPAGDSALVTAASRNGADPSIRATLASEDAAFRKRKSRFGIFRGRDSYFRAYSRQALDAFAELERFRNAGVATPTAPPQ